MSENENETKIKFNVKFNGGSKLSFLAENLRIAANAIDMKIVNCCPGWAFCTSTTPGSVTSCEIRWDV